MSFIVSSLAVMVAVGLGWVMCKALRLKLRHPPGARFGLSAVVALAVGMFLYVGFGTFESRTYESPDGTRALQIASMGNFDIEKTSLRLKLRDTTTGTVVAQYSRTLRDIFIASFEDETSVRWDAIDVHWGPDDGTVSVTFLDAALTVHLPSGAESW